MTRYTWLGDIDVVFQNLESALLDNEGESDVGIDEFPEVSLL
jgi:hypothetical protein